ncbi:MAG: hypothetical protein PGN16_07295 [Sphingomonas phyllosphaerae]|uniref:hypothetical protein n=1 Tax=Sphingomonas phyllosphaerae TaxID=257003 RepID=UPI002FF9815A
MRFNDSLKTVLAAEARSALGVRAAYRQLVDLIARGRAPADDTLLTRLTQLRERVPEAVRVACARSLALVDAPPALIALFATDTPAVATATLRAVRLDPPAWEALLPRLGPVGRGVLRQRRDLPPSVERALEALGAADLRLGYSPVTVDAVPSEPGERFDIADLVQRIAAHQRAGNEPLLPLAGFQFETDAAGGDPLAGRGTPPARSSD